MISSDEGTFGASCQDKERVGLIQSLKVLPRSERVPPSLALTLHIAAMSLSEATCRIHVFMKHGSGVMGYYEPR